MSEVDAQRQYYADTADWYDEMHVADGDEHCRVGRQEITVGRIVKQAIDTLGLWQVFDLFMTRGKGYHYYDGDRLFHSYSVLNDVPVVRRKFAALRFMNMIVSAGPNLCREAPHVAMFASK